MNVALIPARGGSKAIPRKNLADLGGKPLIAWAIEAALKARSVDEVVVSTDDAEIAAVSKRYGASVPFLRPGELAEDDVPTVAVVEHVLTEIDADVIGVMHPTCPFTDAEDVDLAFRLATDSGAAIRIGTDPATDPRDCFYSYGPTGAWINADQRSLPRQLRPPVYWDPGALWVAPVDHFRAHGFERFHVLYTSGPVVDINEPQDLKRARDLLAERAWR